LNRRLTAIAIFLSLATLPVAAKTPCNTAAELATLQFRQLQAELNVAALKCQGLDFDYAGGYNAFAEKVHPALVENTHQLKALFARTGKGAGYLDRYSTGVFNEVQIRSSSIPDYCEDRANLMRRVSVTSAADMPAVAAEVVGAPYAGEACPAKEPPHRKIQWAK
jgi:hypothetical protein